MVAELKSLRGARRIPPRTLGRYVECLTHKKVLFGGIMPITRLLQNASFGPDEIRVLVRAFDEALGTLRVDRNGPVADALAKKIIELAQQGERDPILLRQHAVRSVSQSK
jgi:hypothetical protein